MALFCSSVRVATVRLYLQSLMTCSMSCVGLVWQNGQAMKSSGVFRKISPLAIKNGLYWVMGMLSDSYGLKGFEWEFISCSETLFWSCSGVFGVFGR